MNPATAVDTAAMDEVTLAMLETERRRMELRAEMAARRKQAQDAESAAVPWWEQDCPPNMVNVQSWDELASAIDSACAAGKLVVVNFFSPECYACRSMQPKLRQIAGDVRESVTFLKVNGFLDGLRDYCEEEGITQIPFFRFYRQKEMVAEFTANMQPQKLKLLRRNIELHSGAGAEAGAAAAGQA